MRLRPRHVRTRLTLWYVGVLAGVLTLYVGSTLVFLYVSQRRELDRRVYGEFETVEDLLTVGPDGSIRMGGHGDEESGRLVEVWSAEGGLAYRSDALHGEALGGLAPGAVPMKESLAEVTLADQTPLRVFNFSLARIEQSFGQLRRFTADASHELRTPLTAIRTVGEVALQEQLDSGRYREAIGSMLEEVDRLSRLVGSLLVLSRGDAGPTLRRQQMRLLDLTTESAGLLEILADEKGQRIEVYGDAGVTAEVDGLILRQALINLIDNAIKYSPRDSLIRIDVLREEGGAAVMAVSDQGPGIPEADRTRVFERFYRIDEARSREDGGAGLGLSIALWAVQAHGGRIDVHSQEGAGSTFRIVLPETSDMADG